MWTFLGNLMPGGVWEWVGAALLAGLPLWFGYRLGRRTAMASEQRQILKELLAAMSVAKRLEKPTVVNIGLGSLMGSREVREWKDRHDELWSSIGDLLAQCTTRGLQKRLRNIAALSTGKYGDAWTALTDHRDWSKEDLEQVVLDDARNVVTTVLRGKKVRPVRDHRKSPMWIEMDFLAYGGEYPDHAKPSRARAREIAELTGRTGKPRRQARK